MNPKVEHVIDFLVVNLEGGYDEIHDDPNDIGGITRAGIASKYWPDFDLKNATREDILDFYEKNFYSKVKNIEWNSLKYFIFLTGVNTGVKPLVKILQQTINKINMDQNPILEDGIYGKNTERRLKDTLITMEAKDPVMFEVYFWDRFNMNVLSYYNSRKTAKYHFRGWYNRIMKTMAYIMNHGGDVRDFLKGNMK